MGTARLLLALSVMLAHLPALRGPLVHGRVAVEGFYIISGFYMALILDRKYRGAEAGPWLFYSNRLLRLFPVYLVLLAAALALRPEVWARFREGWDAMGGGAATLLVGTNLALFGQDLVQFLRLDPATGGLALAIPPAGGALSLQKYMFIPQAWTLGVELLFYLMAPFVLGRRTAVVAGLLALSVAARAWGLEAGLDGTVWRYRFFPFEVAFFLVGSLAYRLHARLPWQRLDRRLVGAAGAVPLALMVAYPLLPKAHVLPTFSAAHLILCGSLALGTPFLFEASKRLRWDRTVGDMSYPLYLCHLLVIDQCIRLEVVAARWLVDPWPLAPFSRPTLIALAGWIRPGVALLTVAVALLVAHLLARWVDGPVDRYRQRRARRAAAG